MTIPNLSLTGAHHRTLLDSGLARANPDGSCAWAVSDAAHYNSTNTDMQLTEAGVCKDFGTVRAGLGVGQAWTQQGLALDGSARFDGQYLIAEVDNQFDYGIQGSITGYVGRYTANVKRGYMNGAAVDFSTGKTADASTALRLRLDWQDAMKYGQFTFSPYISQTWARAKLGAYTETGGGFPAQYGASVVVDSTARAGIRAKTALSGSTDLRISTEYVNGTTRNKASSGQVIGLYGFAVPGQKSRQEGATAIIDVDHRLSRSKVVSIGVSGSTFGGDPSYGLTMAYRASF